MSQNATEAYQLALIKEFCERDFLYFIRYVFFHYYNARWQHNWHHDELIKLVYAIERRDLCNAVVNMPPRYGKTELLVILWMAWTMVRNPAAQFIHVSYSVELALKNSATVRDILRAPFMQAIWPIKMKESMDGKGLWMTEQGGGLKADSSMGAITGFGAGCTTWTPGKPFDGAIICDDPLKPMEARSAAYRESVNENFKATLHSRRNHQMVPIIIIMQRLHVDDPSGMALNGDLLGDKFFHLKLPAIYKEKPLWPLKHTMKQLEIMRESSPHTFAGQYQQEPYIAEGEVYDLGWFARYNNLPPRESVIRIVHSWDTAYKSNQHNDPSVCTVWHCTPTMHYLAEVHRGKWEYPELRKKVLNLANEQKPDIILIEDKASGQSLLQELRRETALPVIAVSPEADKETRARTAAATVEAGKIAVPITAHWLADFESEISSFPRGANDDQVDSMSQFIKYITKNADYNFNAMLDRLNR